MPIGKRFLFYFASNCFVGEKSFALGRKVSAGAGLAPHAGAGTYFHERVKVGKGLPKGEYRFSPFGFPLNDQRLCLWNPTELPLCIYFPHRNKPVRCSLCVRFCVTAYKFRKRNVAIQVSARGRERSKNDRRRTESGCSFFYHG